MTYQSDNMAFNNAMDSLSHYGVLGMKWGVRNEETLRKYAGPLGREIRKASFSERAETRVTKSGKQIAPVSKRQVQRENELQSDISKIERKKQKEAAKNERKKQKQLKKDVVKFEDNYNKNWVNAYNKATDNFNLKLADINSKYDAGNFGRAWDHPEELDNATRKKFVNYVSEVGETWNNEYTSVLLEDFGDHPTLGKQWTKNAPFMNQYNDYLKSWEDMLDEIK